MLMFTHFQMRQYVHIRKNEADFSSFSLQDLLTRLF